MTTEGSLSNNDATAAAMDAAIDAGADTGMQPEPTMMGGGSGPTPEPVPSDAIGKDNGGAGELAAKIEEGFFDKIDPELRENISLSRYKSVNDLAKAYLNAESAIGKDKVMIPDKHATDEDWKAFYGKTAGLPQRYEDYNVEVPAGVKLEDGQLTEIKRLGYENNMMPSQIEKVLSYQYERDARVQEERENEYKAQAAEQAAQLEKKWGEQYEQNLSRIHQMTNNVSQALGEEKINTFLMQPVGGKPLGNSSVMIEIFDYFSSLMNLEDIDEGVATKRLNPTELQGKVDSIMGNFEHPFHIKDHPNHDAAVKEVNSYFERMNPSRKKSMGGY